jgi:hypothetical protein
MDTGFHAGMTGAQQQHGIEYSFDTEDSPKRCGPAW